MLPAQSSTESDASSNEPDESPKLGTKGKKLIGRDPLKIVGADVSNIWPRSWRCFICRVDFTSMAPVESRSELLQCSATRGVAYCEPAHRPGEDVKDNVTPYYYKKEWREWEWAKNEIKKYAHWCSA